MRASRIEVDLDTLEQLADVAGSLSKSLAYLELAVRDLIDPNGRPLPRLQLVPLVREASDA